MSELLFQVSLCNCAILEACWEIRIYLNLLTFLLEADEFIDFLLLVSLGCCHLLVKQ